MNKIYIGVAVLVLAGLVWVKFPTKNLSVAGFLTPTVTTSVVTCGGSISGATSTLWTSANAYQYVLLSNFSAGNVYWGFGSTMASTTKGLALYSVASTTGNSSREITDPNLLKKLATCVGSPTSTVHITAY